jgi:hypothetical protein
MLQKLRNVSAIKWLLYLSLLLGSVGLVWIAERGLRSYILAKSALVPTSPCSTASPQDFLVFGGGPSPASNEIALEKNILYFQRTLKALNYPPEQATVFFANGNNGQATVRYLDPQQNQQFKPPQIPYLQGASTPVNLKRSLQKLTQPRSPGGPIFFYFTGHGHLNQNNPDNNGLYLWGNLQVSVQQLGQMLDRLPPQKPFVTMMSQCYAGSFANLIYKAGDPKQGVALQTRCGFFATIKTETSVGCTPEVNEADYRDYSSSFYAGLSGRDRVGNAVSSADYNRNGWISFAEAHAFAKIDEKTTDLPISTSEVWLHQQFKNRIQSQFLTQPIARVIGTARPEQRYVIDQLTARFRFQAAQSFYENLKRIGYRSLAEEEQAYLTRLAMELENVGIEQRLRVTGQPATIATLDRLLKCEANSWGRS